MDTKDVELLWLASRDLKQELENLAGVVGELTERKAKIFQAASTIMGNMMVGIEMPSDEVIQLGTMKAVYAACRLYELCYVKQFKTPSVDLSSPYPENTEATASTGSDPGDDPDQVGY